MQGCDCQAPCPCPLRGVDMGDGEIQNFELVPETTVPPAETQGSGWVGQTAPGSSMTFFSFYQKLTGVPVYCDPLALMYSKVYGH